MLKGRLLHVLPAKAPSSAVVAVEEAGEGARHAAGSSYKAQKEEKRKADAGTRHTHTHTRARANTHTRTQTFKRNRQQLRSAEGREA